MMPHLLAVTVEAELLSTNLAFIAVMWMLATRCSDLAPRAAPPPPINESIKNTTSPTAGKWRGWIFARS